MNHSMNREQGQPPQHQTRKPGIEARMNPIPVTDNVQYKGSGKLQGKTAIITGGDSGIGKAVTLAFVKEGANIAIVYLDEHEDAKKTKQLIEQYGGRCVLFAGDIGDETFCQSVVQQTMDTYGGIQILVNNAGEHQPQNGLENIEKTQLQKVFATNVFSYFYFAKACLPHFTEGASIINTTSVTAYKGNEKLLDYSATKGAIVSFTRSLSQSLVSKGIRVNGVAPGPIWTPLIPSSFPAHEVAMFGTDVPMKRAGQPYELAASYVYLASDDSSYMTGQILHLNGGIIVNG
ncbi:SDR family oxidoreductase [Priestia taiwanensis]|uniref:glucose 1-dehydrogenase [NAD(P)(+)] n=1 Tax=Priestia taiwanensis TaxID=1347902 RepID=A0A917EQK5_9BACI|nr:SDR family oxidoreductase [Priestia taiwanensis]MBM7364319.1 NAD(P)-dependent dehydrogenase (short-subunit alcohol dehydrogenase family) [Priestia taiwanensis]GGE73484.1 NAD(P)-dependent oxidoreductase [Priestia taiwanensis]